MTTQPKTTEAENPYLTREDALAILNTPDDQLDELIARAEKLRRKYKGDNVGIHILTNARSGNCSQDCAYCAQSCRSSADIEKYKWVSDEKLYRDNDFVNKNHLARHCIGLSGMKFTDAEIEELATKIRKMKETGTHLCCSIGFLTEKSFWRTAPSFTVTASAPNGTRWWSWCSTPPWWAIRKSSRTLPTPRRLWS